MEALSAWYSGLRSGNNELIQQATVCLNEFYMQQESVQLHLEYMKASKDAVMRRYAIVGLSKCVENVWKDMAPDVCEKLFVEMLHLLTHEEDWNNRQSLIDVIGSVMVDAYEETVYQFVVQSAESGKDAFLEMALLMASLIPAKEAMLPLVMSILERGFNSEQPLVRMASFHYVLSSKYHLSNAFFEKFPAFWDCMIEVLGDCAEKMFELKRITGLFSKAVREKVCPGYPESLLSLCLSLYKPYKESGKLVDFGDFDGVVKDICHVYYVETLASQKIGPVLAVYFDWSMTVFDAGDAFAVSGSSVVEPIVHSLCRSVEAASFVYEHCQSLLGTDPGKFIFLRCVGETVSAVPAFYEPKIDDITNVIKSCLSSGSLLLAETAGRTISDLMKFCCYEKEEFSMDMVPLVFQACQQSRSAELLNVCAELFDTIHGTDYIFDDIFPVLIEILKSGPVDMQYGALKCIGALVHGSQLKAGAAATTLLGELLPVLKNDDAEAVILKAPALDCLSNVTQAVQLTLNDQVKELLTLLMNSLDSDDISLAIASLNVFESLVWHHPEVVAPTIDAFLPKLNEKAMFNISDAYMASLVEAEPLQREVFSITACCLRILAKVTIKYPNSFEKVSAVLLDYCEMHKMSPCSAELKVAVAKSVKYLAKSASVAWDTTRIGSSEQEEYGVRKLCGILMKMFTPEADTEVLCEILRAMRTLMLYFGFYDIGDDYIAFFIERSREIIETIDKDSYRPVDPHHDLFESLFLFVDSFCHSAGKESVNKLTCLVDIFVKMAQDSAQRYRSLAMRFLGSLVGWGQEKINKELTLETVRFAMQMAQNDVDFAPFWALKKLIQYAEDVIQPLAGDLYQIFLSRLKETHVRSERTMKFRDNCVSCLLILILTFYEDPSSCNIDECLPVILNALPLAVDFQDSSRVFRYLELVNQKLKSSFREQYFRVLVEIFSSSDRTLKEMSIDNYVKILMGDLVEILKSLPNPQQVCSDLCKGDRMKIENLNRRLQ